jgi:phosphonate transport system substrate-binding protein
LIKDNIVSAELHQLKTNCNSFWFSLRVLQTVCQIQGMSRPFIYLISKRFIWFGALGLLYFLVSFSSQAQPKLSKLEESVPLREWIVALKPDRNPDAMTSGREQLSAELRKLLGVPVKVIVPSSSAIIQQAFQNKSVDLAFLSATDFLIHSEEWVDPLLVAEVRGKTNYESIWLVRRDSAYQSLSELKNKPVAFASRTSTSGHLVPWAHLIKQGLLKKGQSPELFFGRRSVNYGTGYVSVVERLLQGEVEAAAVSDYVFDLDRHLSPEQKSKLRVLQRQGPVPTHLMAIRKSILEADREKITKALLNLPKPLAEELFSGQLVAVDFKKHLAPLQEVFELTQAKEFMR